MPDRSPESRLSRPRGFVILSIAWALALPAPAVAEPAPSPPTLQEKAPAAATSMQPVFRPKERAVSTWRREASAHLDLTPETRDAILAGTERPVARCVKLNNYWCIKKAGWDGEIASDAEGHVAFATATEGAAVAALLLKRYYVDFGRKTAMAIIAHWAPAQCGGPLLAARLPRRSLAPRGLAGTLRARWLATHSRGFVTPSRTARATIGTPHRSTVQTPMPRMMPAPTIAVGLGETSRPLRPITLDALLQNDPRAPRSRSMLGMPGQAPGHGPVVASCSGDGARIAAYATKAAAGLKLGEGGDLQLFDAKADPTRNLAVMMANMARVEIGPLGVEAALIEAGIADAFRPGRNGS